jgi:hypothetical protein
VRLKLHQSGPWIGFGGAFMVLFVGFPAIFFYAPPWGIALIFSLTLAQLVIVVLLAKRHPVWCTYVPIGGLVAYFLLLFAGLKWWGWGE